MKTPIYISILLVFLLFSCTKFGRNVTIKGKVINPVTQEPIEGVEAWFQKTTIGLPGGYKTIKEEITDANGEFEINAGRIGAHYIRLGDVKGNYRLGWYENGEYNGTSVKEVDKGKVMEVEYHLVPYGEVVLDIENINCESAQDTMWFRSKTEFEDNYPSSWTFPRVGCYSYTSASPFKIPIGTYIYETKVKRSGNITFVYDTVTVNETGVSTIFIDY